jgi:hypothetical protein
MGAHRTPVLGHIDCPTCPLDMDVKKDKNGHAMGFCMDCGQQLFTRSDYRSAKLLARMRPVAPDQPEAAPPAPDPASAPAAPASSAAPSTKATPPKQEHKQDTNTLPPVSGGWLRPLMGAGARKENKHA